MHRFRQCNHSLRRIIRPNGSVLRVRRKDRKRATRRGATVRCIWPVLFAPMIPSGARRKDRKRLGPSLLQQVNQALQGANGYLGGDPERRPGFSIEPDGKIAFGDVYTRTPPMNNYQAAQGMPGAPHHSQQPQQPQYYSQHQQPPSHPQVQQAYQQQHRTRLSLISMGHRPIFDQYFIASFIMTTMTTQRYMYPSSYGTANTFAQPTSRNSSKGGNFLKMFGTAVTNSRTVEPQQIEENQFAFMVYRTKLTSLPHATPSLIPTRFRLGLHSAFNG